MTRLTAILQDLLMHALDADTTCAAHRARIDGMLSATSACDPEQPYALLTRRGRGRLRDAITEYALAVSDLCALLTPSALAAARQLDQSLLPGAEEYLLELSPVERHALLAPIFAAATALERLSPATTEGNG